MSNEINESFGNDAIGTSENEIAWMKWSALGSQAYCRFQGQLSRMRSQHPGLTSYEAVERAKETKGTMPWWWGAPGEIQETINSINSWSVRLHEWAAWNWVVDSYDTEEDKWDVLNHFVEPVAFYCMLQPSSLADRFAV